MMESDCGNKQARKQSGEKPALASLLAEREARPGASKRQEAVFLRLTQSVHSDQPECEPT